MCWWAYLGSLYLLSYLFLTFKLFVIDYRETKEQGINPEYSDILVMLIMAALWPVYAVTMLYEDLLFRFRREKVREFYRKIREVFYKLRGVFCRHKWELEFVHYGITNELCVVYICKKCGKRKIENE